VNEGCQRLTWQEWIQRCLPDRIRAAAQVALAEAVTERTAAILLDQLNGALTAAVRGIVADIGAAGWTSAAESIDELLSRQELGLHLTNPWRVVVSGPPNVGKSSLINALAGYERAIVSPTPGTTRDVVTVTTAINGWPVILSDTAGFRETQDELESAGIKLATNTLSRADLAIFVHDAAMMRDGSADDEANLVQPKLAGHVRVVNVINKIDLIPAADRSQLIQRFVSSRSEFGQPHVVSALNGEGISDLMSTIARALVPVSIPAGSAVPFTTAQVNGLAAAKAAIEQRDAETASEMLLALLTNAG
jgi:tRNA modification GTPase